MSDFLSNLAARTLAPAPLAPRARLRFESAPVEDSCDSVEAHRLSMREQADATSPVVSLPPTQQHSIQHTSPEQVRPVSPIPARSSGRESPHPDAMSVGRRSEEPEQPELLERNRSTIERRAEADPDLRRMAPRRRAEAEEPQRSLDAVKPRQEEAPPPWRPIQSRLVGVERSEGGLQRSFLASRVGPVVNAPPRSRALVTPGRSWEARVSEPTVEVSIGLVEIRAVKADQPRTPSRRGAAMTIEDYVARRRGSR